MDALEPSGHFTGSSFGTFFLYSWSMTEPTIFHKILTKEIPADIVHEDKDVLVFKDIHPTAKTHLLFVPKKFVASVADASGDTEYLPGLLILKAQQFAKEQGIDGYKLLFNVGKNGGQEVPYLHLHFMSEQSLKQ